MLWSKLKKEIESRICDPLSNRIQFHVCGYHKGMGMRNEVGRGWITVDKKEVLNGSDFTFWKKQSELRTSSEMSYEKTYLELGQFGIYGRDSFLYMLERYLLLTIDEAFKSKDILTKSLAIIDRRFGKRRLRNLSNTIFDHELPEQFLKLRLETQINEL